MGGLKTLEQWLAWQENLHFQEIDLGLERIHKVYQNLFPTGVNFKVITVAGTNGKGSTIAFIDSIYQQANIKVAQFTSPHILHYNERFCINGVQANDVQICTAFEQIEQARGNTSLTYFEFSTLAALIIFTNEKVAVAVLEIGLGGRLDSVNVVDSDVGVITNIDIDHVNYLGATRKLIGQEKAGIMRGNIPCVCADLNPPNSIIQYAEKIGALLTFINTPYSGAISLQGEHQKTNAALAIAAINQLQSVFTVKQNQLARGIENAKLSARFQTKIVNGKTLVLDVAHNPAAVQVLTDTLNIDKQPTIAIFSALNDKNIEAMISTIAPLIDEWLLVPLKVNRAITMQDLSEKFSLSSKIKVYKNISSAIHQALNAKQAQRIVIFGSFHIVGDTLKVLE
ncbi:Dihydrofolate synthase @ Folylpolyglutamate synthase [Bathymodiolus heckerae thiotrophic gill symbiont]|uniref:bifunctional folylpolyglutamate synthase/dihydrofolate synthase n=1 Tax=Bathymodiolus heckerae thiotrophic gill symbiont TaxID=1052212 RepID=UPI0010B693B4|nr:folylpolyglutamate synthase/dihydrofolate synthase family protein [Bathymodiolus heckerae thiotrophic gill symbiont]CAC9446619.1 Dihydrofolate synthase (EC 6.3.2.12) @ Folylpolyglutamate synthase (EC 6.3.2.17) [uncultured Gammaproteobacteria bacterium]SMN13989.1 Dihydrofolate synthase @ Folylpolyglutamate synthase [Bathymodiolus heckerae thiotrophic gill symbiont]SMN16373.1 Dihydrofolate synthase @ Folylpolyglutamate synthase [uncultured Candidatus Thioglobus sp.]